MNMNELPGTFRALWQNVPASRLQARPAAPVPVIQQKKPLLLSPAPMLRSAAPDANAPPIAQTKTGRSAGNTGAVQCFFTQPPNQKTADLMQELLRIDKAQPTEARLGEKMLFKCVNILKYGGEHFGSVDARNSQILGLFYFQAVRVARRFSVKGQNKAQLGEDAKARNANQAASQDLNQKVYKLAILGAGAAAAFYIDTLGTAYDHRFTLLIGLADPWAEKRGQGIDFVNHVPTQISYPSHGVPDFEAEFMKRKSFAAKTKSVITRAIPKANRYCGEIQNVDLVAAGPKAGLHAIQWKAMKGATKTWWARKVIVASGAGPHSATTADQNNVNVEDKPRIMDMDTFIREIVPKDKAHSRRVVVQGPSAAIDAVAAAHLRNWTITWFINSTTPVYLPGTKYRLGAIPLYKADKVSIASEDDYLNVTAHVKKCTLLNHQFASAKEINNLANWDAAQVQKMFKADYFVYGIGQNINAHGSVGQFLSANLQKNLAPVYHTDGRYSTVGGDRVADKVPTAIGSGNLQVIGAAAKGLSKKELQTELHGVVKHLSADVVAYEQIGGIRSAMYGLNNTLPPDIGTRVDFSSADVTALRAHISVKYPNIREHDATRIINDILAHRKTGHHPHGYDNWWITHWTGVLASWDRYGRR